MTEVQLITAWVATQYVSLRGRISRDDTERGDVPGWVMVTVMTAGLVVAIFAVFKTKITTAIDSAITNVTTNTK